MNRSTFFRFKPLFFAVITATIAISCTKKNPAEVAAPSAERGRVVYQSYCISCHNSDPRKSGSLGPEVYGSSRELLEARTLRAEYPAGYKPKRPTHTMPPMPYIKNDLESLYLFLNKP